MILGDEFDASLSLPDLADQRISLPHLSKGSLDAIDIALADHEDHAQTVIESPIHLCLRNRSRPLDQLKDRRHRPTMPLEPCALPSRQNPWKVPRNTASRNMGDPLDGISLNETSNGLRVDSGRLQQFLAKSSSQIWESTSELQPFELWQNLARKGISIAVKTARMEADKKIARSDRLG